MAATWWNDKYLFRRRIKIVPGTSETIKDGYPIHVSYDRLQYVTMNKLRPDSNDVEIVYSPDVATPIHVVVPFMEVTDLDDPVADLVFNAEQDFSTTNEDYYLYFNNPELVNQPSKPNYINADYVISLTPTSYNSNLTFSRPNEDWAGGFSDKPNARAALSFYGPYARIRIEKGPDRGILELKIDDNPPVLLDTYHYIRQNATLYTATGLDIDRHYFRMRVTGDKHPSSAGTGVKFISFDYSIYAQGILQTEEIKSISPPVRTVVGP